MVVPNTTARTGSALHLRWLILVSQLMTPDGSIPAVDEYLTDLGNARRLVRMFCRDMRFVSEWGWLVWDGKRWAADRTGTVMRWANKTALSLYDDAANALDKAEQATRDEKQRAAAGDKAGAARAAADSERYSDTSEEVKKWARTSQMRTAIGSDGRAGTVGTGCSGTPGFV